MERVDVRKSKTKFLLNPPRDKMPMLKVAER
jgi:hypothetical protein